MMSQSDVAVQQQKSMPKPTNDIDMQAITTFPHISSEYMSDRIRNKFREFDYMRDKEGKIMLDKNNQPMIKITNDIWAVMELFTQDLRLANLNKEEAGYIRHNIDLCSDILITMPHGFSKPALICLERAINVSETSQSKGGFLRRMFNTFFSHTNNKEEEPKTRSFFGLGKKKNME